MKGGIRHTYDIGVADNKIYEGDEAIKKLIGRTIKTLEVWLIW